MLHCSGMEQIDQKMGSEMISEMTPNFGFPLFGKQLDIIDNKCFLNHFPMQKVEIARISNVHAAKYNAAASRVPLESQK